MKVLIPTNNLPHSSHTVRAFNVVLYELISALSSYEDIQVIILPTYIGRAPKLTHSETEGLSQLQALGVTVLEPFEIPIYTRPKNLLVRIFNAVFQTDLYFYPHLHFKSLIPGLLDDINPDVLLTIWNENLTSYFSFARIPKIAYYGNPDPKPIIARASYEFKHGSSRLKFYRSLLIAKLLGVAHNRLMRRWDTLLNVALNDSLYYKKNGHPRSFYIQNLWINRGKYNTEHCPSAAHSNQSLPIRIAANIGKLNGTANTHGLEYLSDSLLPAMRDVFGDQPFELLIFGANKPPYSPHPSLSSLWLQPEVRLCGFVDDIDAELQNCNSFLCVNNASSYNVGHTRYLHAWSLGCCVIAHKSASLAMPELQDGYNCLLGSSPVEIARHLLNVAYDSQLRDKLSSNGFKTFSTTFTGKSVASILRHHIISNCTP